MAYGPAPKRPQGAVMPAAPMEPVVMGDQVPRVSRLGPLKIFLPAIYGQMTDMARKLNVLPDLLEGNVDTLDAETTGFNRSKCVMWQLSAMRFRKFEPAEHLDRVISISREDYDNAFYGQADKAEIMQKIHLTWERIEQEGVPAKQVLDEFQDFLGGPSTLPLLGFHTRSIDLPFIQILWGQHYPGIPVFFPMHRLIDVGVAVKAAQLDNKMLSSESVESFMRRITATRAKRIYWSVQYITEQLGFEIDHDALHDALTDCAVVGMIWDYVAHQEMTPGRMQDWRERLERGLKETVHG